MSQSASKITEATPASRAPDQMPLAPELSVVPPMPPASTPTVSMGRGHAGFNIKPPAPRVFPVEGDVPIGNMRRRWFLKPELDRLPPVAPRRTVDDLSFVFNLLAILAL